jgi:HD-GYP domain-containing protein (c-di-GMP phosphodiesterase class II)
MALAAIWIVASDHAVNGLVHDPAALTQLQSIKGWLFVAATGLLLYGLIGRDMRRMARLNQSLVRGQEQSLRVLVSAMELRHKETGDHSDRVMRMAVGLAKLAGIRGDELRHLKFGSLLHDIGKLAVPDAILAKPGRLDDAEMAQMRTHANIGGELLQRFDFLRPAADIPRSHHERWDGGGYPQGLRGEQIPLAARIFSVVDIWDALSFDRAYKAAWPEAEVLAYLRNAAGTQLDPTFVTLFLENYTSLKALALAVPASRATVAEARRHGTDVNGAGGVAHQSSSDRPMPDQLPCRLGCSRKASI